MNESLTNLFISKESFTVLKQMHSSKALRPNDMTVLFFLKLWHIVGPSFTHTIMHIFNNGLNPDFINQIFVTFILKAKHLDNPSQ